MKKTNLIIDGNNIFYQSLFVIKTGKSQTKPLLSTEDEQEMLIRKIATDLSFTIRHFNNVSRIIFTIDSQSWRKGIEIEENDGYKSTREKTTKIDWNSFYSCMNQFAKILETHGIIVSKIDNAEGDDLMFLWQNYFRQLGENSIIVTSDKDMLQMIHYDDESYTVVYRPNSLHRKIVVPPGFVDWVKNDTREVDIFNTGSFMGRSTDIIAAAMEKIPVEELEPNMNIIEKVLVGDGGDAVPTVFAWETTSKNGNKNMNRLTPKRVEKIVRDINSHVNVLDLPKHYQSITRSIKSITKVKDINEKDILNRLERNIKLVVLDETVIPEEIQLTFKDFVGKSMELPTVATKQFSMNSLLEGTKFVKASEAFQSDIFSGINKYTKQKKKLF